MKTHQQQENETKAKARNEAKRLLSILSPDVADLFCLELAKKLPSINDTPPDFRLPYEYYMQFYYNWVRSEIKKLTKKQDVMKTQIKKLITDNPLSDIDKTVDKIIAMVKPKEVWNYCDAVNAVKDGSHVLSVDVKDKPLLVSFLTDAFPNDGYDLNDDDLRFFVEVKEIGKSVFKKGNWMYESFVGSFGLPTINLSEIQPKEVAIQGGELENELYNYLSENSRIQADNEQLIIKFFCDKIAELQNQITTLAKR